MDKTGYISGMAMAALITWLTSYWVDSYFAAFFGVLMMLGVMSEAYGWLKE